MNGINKIYHEPPINSIVGISSTFNLTYEDLQKRSSSFLDAQTLRLAGVRRVNNDIAHQILGKETRIKDVEYAGLAIPYFQFRNDGTRYVAEWTLRRDVPDYEKNGRGELKEKRKYIKYAGVKNQLYIPPMLPPETLADQSLPIVFVEGEFKAAALARIATRDFSEKDWSFVPLGLSGVDNFKKTGKAETPHGERRVSEELTEFQRIAFENRSVGICFDSDLSDKPAVKAARASVEFSQRKEGKSFSRQLSESLSGRSDQRH